MKVGFITANFVAQAAGFDGSNDWGAHDRLTRSEIQPADLADPIAEIGTLGFDGLSIWTAHCWYHGCSPSDITTLRELAAEAGLEMFAYAGGFGLPPDGGDGDPRSDWRRTFEVADALGANHLAGGFGDPDNREIVVDLAEEFGMPFGFENHPEGSVEEIQDAIAGYRPLIKVAFDTGWAGTQGFSAPEAIHALGDDIIEVHLKDVTEHGSHHSCALGDGVVDIPGCLEALREIGFDGWISIEHEPYDRNPMPEIRTSMNRLESWIGG